MFDLSAQTGVRELAGGLVDRVIRRYAGSEDAVTPEVLRVALDFTLANLSDHTFQDPKPEHIQPAYRR